ncbi:MAG TPA: TIGR03617 family F420-dependent LLM class oxidoreductase [Acidimicrobiales bacterium]
MQIDAMNAGGRLQDTQRFAREVEAAGLDGLWITEGGRTPFLQCAAAALATSRITIGTAVAVAFPRSPFVTASSAWELADASGGRFILGLGTQVRAHVERRYGVAYAPPGPRLRDYVAAVRACWRAFQSGEPLDHRGEFYELTIGKLGAWSGGPIEHPDIPVYLAGVRPWMLQMIGAVADGVHVHPFHSRRYLDEVVLPNIATGRERAGRRDDAVRVVVPVMTVVGDTEAERARLREHARFQIAFYGSTRTYADVFEIHGWHGLSTRLHELQRAGDTAGMAAAITDEMLHTYALESSWDELADRLVERYAGVADRVVMYTLGNTWRHDESVMARWADVATGLHQRS